MEFLNGIKISNTSDVTHDYASYIKSTVHIVYRFFIFIGLYLIGDKIEIIPYRVYSP